jgi:hypothetical protein
MKTEAEFKLIYAKKDNDRLISACKFAIEEIKQKNDLSAAVTILEQAINFNGYIPNYQKEYVNCYIFRRRKKRIK